MDSKEFVENILQPALDDVYEGITSQTYEEAGVLSGNAGLVVKLKRGGQEFQITVVEC